MASEFGQEWTINALPYRDSKSIYQLSNPEIGAYYIDHESSLIISGIESKYFSLVIGVILELSRRGKPLFISTRENVRTFQDFNNGCVTFSSVEEIFRLLPRNVFEKQERGLINLYMTDPGIGHSIPVSFQMFFCEDNVEFEFIITSMKNKGLIDILTVNYDNEFHVQSGAVIQEAGWRLIEGLLHTSAEASKQVFVAMWFNSLTDLAFSSIAETCRNLGFSPLRIDNKEHNNEISGEILYEIRKSRFIIADVTGERQGVYFEAGYAIGLGIQVIWSCKETDKEKIHFDTRQYNHILWKDESDLAAKLLKRIKGTVLLAQSSPE